MLVDTNIYGYVAECDILCLDCAPPRDGDGGDILRPLLILDDEDPHGTICDACGNTIFEPVEAHRVEPDGTCEYGCFSYCGDTESCYLHQTVETDIPAAERFIDPLVLDVETGERENPFATLWDVPATDYPDEEA